MTSKTIRYEPPLLGKLRVTIHRCCQLSCEAPQKADELFPWVLVCVGDSEECTLAQPFGQDVIWEHTVELPVRDPLGFLDVEVFSGKGIKRSGLGSAEVDLNGLIQDQETTVWLGLQGVCGFVNHSCMPLFGDSMEMMPHRASPGGPGALGTRVGKLRLMVQF